jgi:hypothetical protein
MRHASFSAQLPPKKPHNVERRPREYLTADEVEYRVAGNLVRKYTLSYKCLFFKGLEHYYLFCSRQHPSGLLQITKKAKCRVKGWRGFVRTWPICSRPFRLAVSH